MRKRSKAIVALIVVVLALGSLFRFYGYDNTWKLWNIPTMSPHFADLRSITGGAESYRQGLDPLKNNPGDPWGRKLNYPRVWQSLYLIGVTQNHTTYLGLAFILSFLVGVCLFLPDATLTMVLLVMAAVLSPASLLAIERGNTDLLMFFLISVSIVSVNRWHLVSAMAVLLGFILKLFPFFGCAVLLKLDRSKLCKFGFGLLALAVLYMIINFSDLMLIREGTPKSTYLSYGLNVLWMERMRYSPSVGEYVKFFSYLAVFISLFFACTAVVSDKFNGEFAQRVDFLDAFRAGAAVYIGTFLLGNNYDYRLIFLIFTIPQLIVWIRCSAAGISIISVVVLLSIFLSMWYLLIAKIFFHLSLSYIVSFILDEIANWIVFIGLLYLFFGSLPEWIKEYTQTLVAKPDQQT